MRRSRCCSSRVPPTAASPGRPMPLHRRVLGVADPAKRSRPRGGCSVASTVRARWHAECGPAVGLRDRGDLHRRPGGVAGDVLAGDRQRHLARRHDVRLAPIPDGKGLTFTSPAVHAGHRDDRLRIGRPVDQLVGARHRSRGDDQRGARRRQQIVYVQSGWLRASQRALDESASTPTRPVHTQTEADAEPLPTDGSVVPVRVEIFPFAHPFRAGSSLRVTIDAPGNCPAGVAVPHDQRRRAGHRARDRRLPVGDRAERRPRRRGARRLPGVRLPPRPTLPPRPLITPAPIVPMGTSRYSGANRPHGEESRRRRRHRPHGEESRCRAAPIVPMGRNPAADGANRPHGGNQAGEATEGRGEDRSDSTARARRAVASSRSSGFNVAKLSRAWVATGGGRRAGRGEGLAGHERDAFRERTCQQRLGRHAEVDPHEHAAVRTGEAGARQVRARSPRRARRPALRSDGGRASRCSSKAAASVRASATISWAIDDVWRSTACLARIAAATIACGPDIQPTRSPGASTLLAVPSRTTGASTAPIDVGRLAGEAQRAVRVVLDDDEPVAVRRARPDDGAARGQGRAGRVVEVGDHVDGLGAQPSAQLGLERIGVEPVAIAGDPDHRRFGQARRPAARRGTSGARRRSRRPDRTAPGRAGRATAASRSSRAPLDRHAVLDGDLLAEHGRPFGRPVLPGRRPGRAVERRRPLEGRGQAARSGTWPGPAGHQPSTTCPAARSRGAARGCATSAAR